VAHTWGLVPQMHQLEQQVYELGEMAGLRWNLPFENYKGPVQYIAPADTIKLGTDELSILFTPGHSPGHICFYNEQQHFLINGDVVFRGSIGRTDLPGGNHQLLLNSIANNILTLPNETIIYSGHGDATTVGHEKKTNPYLQEL
jgi:hydroxyacylglutathione hydrolase